MTKSRPRMVALLKVPLLPEKNFPHESPGRRRGESGSQQCRVGNAEHVHEQASREADAQDPAQTRAHVTATGGLPAASFNVVHPLAVHVDEHSKAIGPLEGARRRARRAARPVT